MTFERSFGSGGIQRTMRVRWTSGAVSSWIACGRATNSVGAFQQLGDEGLASGINNEISRARREIRHFLKTPHAALHKLQYF
jgi:hypothetical protein